MEIACNNNEVDVKFKTSFKYLTISQLIHLSVLILCDTMGMVCVPLWPLPVNDKRNDTIDLTNSTELFLHHSQTLKSLVQQQNLAREKLFKTVQESIDRRVLEELNDLFKNISDIKDQLEECLSKLSSISKDRKNKKLQNLVLRFKELISDSMVLSEKCWEHYEQSQNHQQ